MILMSIIIFVMGQFRFSTGESLRGHELPGVYQKPKLIKFVEPAFPNDSELKNEDITVVVNALIDTDGHIVAFKFRDQLGDRLKEAVVAALKGMLFEPGRDSTGKAVEVWFPISIPISDRNNFVPPPAFPAKADSYGIDSGRVIVDVSVDPSGSVIEARVRESSSWVFEAAALKSAINSKFSSSPDTRWFTIVYHFKKGENR